MASWSACASLSDRMIVNWSIILAIIGSNSQISMPGTLVPIGRIGPANSTGASGLKVKQVLVWRATHQVNQNNRLGRVLDAGLGLGREQLRLTSTQWSLTRRSAKSYAARYPSQNRLRRSAGSKILSTSASPRRSTRCVHRVNLKRAAAASGLPQTNISKDTDACHAKHGGISHGAQRKDSPKNNFSITPSPLAGEGGVRGQQNWKLCFGRSKVGSIQAEESGRVSEAQNNPSFLRPT